MFSRFFSAYEYHLLLWALILVLGLPVGAFFIDFYSSAFSSREINITHAFAIDDLTFQSSGSVAWGDYDGDGDDDVLVASHTHRVALLENREGNFVDVTFQSGLSSYQIHNVNAAYFGDYNNDSCVDIFMVSGRDDALFKNDCDGGFVDVTEGAFVKIRRNVEDQGFSMAWGDYNNDSFLDLYITHYSDASNVLYKNNGDGTFEDVTEIANVFGKARCDVPGVAHKGKNSLQPVWFDYNNDGWVDLFVANDSDGYSPLYRNNKDGTFTDVTQEAGLCKPADAMGVAVADYDSDLDLDIYVTNAGPNLLWENQGDGMFKNVASELNLDDSETLGWGAAFFDYDNDTDLDLYIVNGDVVFRSVNRKGKGDIRDNRLLENRKGIFTDVTQTTWSSSKVPERGIALSDYNQDGVVDILIGRDGLFQKNNKSLLLEGRSSKAQNWLSMSLRGVYSNPHGIGATIYVTSGDKTQMRHIASGDSFTAQHTYTQHVGLGDAERVEEVRVHWPSGREQVLQNILVNKHLVIREE